MREVDSRAKKKKLRETAVQQQHTATACGSQQAGRLYACTSGAGRSLLGVVVDEDHTSRSRHSREPSARFQVSLCPPIQSHKSASFTAWASSRSSSTAYNRLGNSLVVVQLEHCARVVGPLADLQVFFDVRPRAGVRADLHPSRVDVEGRNACTTMRSAKDKTRCKRVKVRE